MEGPGQGGVGYAVAVAARRLQKGQSTGGRDQKQNSVLEAQAWDSQTAKTQWLPSGCHTQDQSLVLHGRPVTDSLAHLLCDAISGVILRQEGHWAAYP